jgi:hypothetical protein
MNRKDLLWFLGLELFAILWAGVAFALLPSKLLAGALAGGYFVLSGFYMLARVQRWPRKWQSCTWYFLLGHVFAISLPMLISRFVQRDIGFGDVRIWGLPGPVFHNVSTIVFSGLILATVVDWARAKWARPTI